MDVCTGRTVSLGCSSETATALKIGCTPIQNKKVKNRKKKNQWSLQAGDILVSSQEVQVRNTLRVLGTHQIGQQLSGRAGISRFTPRLRTGV